MPNTGCRHTEYRARHCAAMSCWNYVNKCPIHSTAARPAGMCTQTLRRIRQRDPDDLDALAISKQVLKDISSYPGVMAILETVGSSIKEGISLADQVKCALTEVAFEDV